jgi:hypothetical protein
MYDPVKIPFDSVMLFNVIKLKPEVDFDDVEMAMAEMCSVVKESYGDDDGGFIAGQVFKYAGFISEQGTVGEYGAEGEHLAIVTYWKSFEQHETSHADSLFLEKFSALGNMCTETKELGYQLLWQGMSGERD